MNRKIPGYMTDDTCSPHSGREGEAPRILFVEGATRVPVIAEAEKMCKGVLAKAGEA